MFAVLCHEVSGLKELAMNKLPVLIIPTLIKR